MVLRVKLALVFAFGLVACLTPSYGRAQGDDSGAAKHGRKYKAPPETSHIEVTVLKGFNKKPIMNAAVIFHPIKDGNDQGTLEVKTDPDGKATIDVIPMGSQVRVQVLANGFATYAEDFEIKEASRQITVSMIRPRAQVSAYTEETGKPSQVQPGIQEQAKPQGKPSQTTPTTPPTPDMAPLPPTAAPAKPQP